MPGRARDAGRTRGGTTSTRGRDGDGHIAPGPDARGSIFGIHLYVRGVSLVRVGTNENRASKVQRCIVTTLAHCICTSLAKRQVARRGR